MPSRSAEADTKEINIAVSAVIPSDRAVTDTEIPAGVDRHN